MLIDKLRTYYGLPDSEQTEYINKNVLGMTEVDQDALAAKIIEARSKRYGFPDIAFLSKFFTGAPKIILCIFPALGLALVVEFAVYFIRYYSINRKK